MPLNLPSACRLGLTAALALGPNLVFADSLWKALSEGSPDVYLRYRHEHVDDEIAGSGAADTVRTAIGYRTGLFHGFGAHVQFEDVRELVGDDDYNVPGVLPVNTQRPLIPDPTGTELNQLSLSYRGLPHTAASLGRLDIAHRKAPLHRFLGNVLWRQNWQTYDAFRLESTWLPATKMDYAYIWNVNRIFGDDSRLGDYPMNSHVFRAEYSGLPIGVLEPYAYVLDFDGPAGSSAKDLTAGFGSTATAGLRLQGERALTVPGYKLMYAAELAWQGNHARNPRRFDHLYYVLEGGLGRAFISSALQSISLKGTLEVQEGDGNSAFTTPLGTNHAFQGWADKFLLTPRDGMRDAYATLAVKAWEAQFLAVYHHMRADHLAYDYGQEWNLQVTRTFFEHYHALLKYARYEGDNNATNFARRLVNGRADADRSVFWASLEFEF